MSLFLHFQRFVLFDFVSLFHHLPDGLGQLVGAGGAFEAAADAFQLGDDVVGFHAFHEGGHALRVAVAAAVELHVFENLTFFYQIICQARISYYICAHKQEIQDDGRREQNAEMARNYRP